MKNTDRNVIFRWCFLLFRLSALKLLLRECLVELDVSDCRYCDNCCCSDDSYHFIFLLLRLFFFFVFCVLRIKLFCLGAFMFRSTSLLDNKLTLSVRLVKFSNDITGITKSNTLVNSGIHPPFFSFAVMVKK